MSPSRLAFVQEFERQLSSYPLRQWFEATRKREAGLQAFADPDSLRRFLHSPERVNSQKPEIWRALVGSLQLDRTPEAVVFVLGLLEPALGHLTDTFDEVELDPDDLWQETVACALKALANPKLLKRRAPLVGLVKDTFQHLCIRLRNEFASIRRQAPLLDTLEEPEIKRTDVLALDASVLNDWCQAAGIAPEDRDVILLSRIAGFPLSHLAPAQSRVYYRLWEHRQIAETQLKAWLHTKREPTAAAQNRSFPKIAPKNTLFKG